MQAAAENERGEIKKIGILRALYLGDSLCIIPAVRAIRKAFPSAAITLIGLKWHKKFVERFSDYFDSFIPFPGWPGLPEQKFIPSQVTGFLSQVQHCQFDLMVQMQGSGSFTNPMCMLFGAKLVAGLRIEGNYCPEESNFPLFTEKENEIRRFLYLVENALGIPAVDPALEFPISAAERRRANQIMGMLGLQAGNYVCIHPGAREVRRRWPPECFAFVADRMSAAGYAVLLTGDTAEKEVTARVKALMQADAVDLVDACGHTGIGELAALIEGSAGLLCNDTGVSHIAAALGTPSVVVFSAHSDPDRWAPLDRSLHIPVYPEQANEPATALAALCRLLHLKQPSEADESLRPHSYV